ncbi:hypothetical protein TNCV_4407181 [Trichonephila clavipes]|nr:hypothetical protein TNCV_4407181 [Trichonephila clavipes]
MFTTGHPLMYMIVITAQIESRFFAEDDLIRFDCSPVLSSGTSLQTRQRPRDEKRRRYNVLSISHGYVATARLVDRALTMRPDRPLDLRADRRDQRVSDHEKLES